MITTRTTRAAGLDTAFVLCVLLLVGASTVYVMFADRELHLDETALYNPVYMWRHYGELTWPAHGRYHDLIIHPAVHYGFVALLMSLGLSVMHAAGLIPVVFFAITGLLLIFSRFPSCVKFGILFGTYLGAFVWNVLYTLRPDVSLAVAWVAGLVGLESARLADWDWKRLLAGSILIAYASIVHYPGFLAVLGVGVYVVWAWLSLPRGIAIRRIEVLCLGACLVWIPYLAFYVYPHRHGIMWILGENQAGWGVGSAFRWHLECYQNWARELAARSGYQPFVSFLLSPALSFRIPAVFIGAPLLFCFRTTRGFALASLPQTLFLLFGAQYKHFVNPGYFAPEMIVCLAGVISAGLCVLTAALGRLPFRSLATLGGWSAIACLSFLTLSDRPLSADRGRLVRDLDEMDLGRAIARRIVGPDAFVGTTSIAAWYTTGARHFYSVRRELFYAPTIGGLNLVKYFAQFDALVADCPRSFDTSNKERENLTTSYVKGLLNLRGFYLADRGGRAYSELSLMFLGTVPPPRLTGYAVRDRRVYRFEEASDGATVFFCAVCPIGDLDNASKELDFFTTYYLPLAPKVDPRFERMCGERMPVLRVLVAGRAQFERDVVPNAKRCKVRQMAVGRLEEVDREALLRELKDSDRPITFYPSLSSALMATGRVGPRTTTAVASSLSVEELKPESSRATLTRVGDAVRITTPPPQWHYAAVAPVRIYDPDLSDGYVHVRARVLKGAVGFGLLSSDSGDFITEHVWDSQDGYTEAFIPVTSFEGVARLIIRNATEGGVASSVVVEEISVRKDKHPADPPAATVKATGTPLRRVGYCEFVSSDL